MCIVEATDQRVGRGEFAEHAAEGDLLGGRKMLVAEEDDAVPYQGRANVGDRRRREFGLQVDAIDACPDRAGESNHIHGAEATVGCIGRTFLRRVASITGVALLALIMLGTWPIWVVLTAVFDLVRRKWRLPTLRLVAFALCWAWIEVAGVLASLLLFTAGQGRNLGAHFALQRSWAGALMSALRFTVGIRIVVENPAVLKSGPILVFSRHASLADSLVSAYAVGNVAGLQPRYVLKRELMADPCLDIVGHRLPNYFLDRGSNNQSEELRGIAELGRNLGSKDVAVIFPEGTRSNPKKRAKILESMAGRSPERAARLAGLAHLLPPKPAGAIALLDAAPDADVVIAGHTGFDGLDTFGGMLKRLERGAGAARMWFVRFPRTEIPADADVVEWLDARWLELDRAVAEHLGQAGGSNGRTKT